MLFSFLLVVHFIVAFSLVTVILMQRSEGGGLTGGGSPAGLMSARGASDFLTRSTAILATGFVLLSFLSFFCGLILDQVSRARHEVKRMAYLSVPGLASLNTQPEPALLDL